VNSFAERFKRARDYSGLSLAQVADCIGVSTQAVWNYENRAEGSIALDLLFPLADALNVEARWLATGEGPMVDNGTPSLEALRVEKMARALVVLNDEKIQALSVLLGIKL
jgi:transcriptional regulator with XRE-family HTH domain